VSPYACYHKTLKIQKDGTGTPKRVECMTCRKHWIVVEDRGNLDRFGPIDSQEQG